MAARVAPGEVQQLHHFVAASPWTIEPLEAELVRQAGRLVGGPDAVLVIDDTAPVQQGRHPVGVARQHRGELAKRANRRVLVSLTPARAEVPVGVGPRRFLPEAWAGDAARRVKAGGPAAIPGRPRWRIALDEPDRPGQGGGGHLRLRAGRRRIRQGGGVPPRPLRARPALGGGHPAGAEGLPGRRDRRAGAAEGDRRAGQAPGAFGQERGG